MEKKPLVKKIVFVTRPNEREQRLAIVEIEQHGADLVLDSSRNKVIWINFSACVIEY